MRVFTNLSLKAKLLSSFGLLSFGVLLLGLLGNRSVNSLLGQINHMAEVETANLERVLMIETMTNQVALEMTKVLSPESSFSGKNEAKARIAEIRVHYGQLIREFDESLIHEEERVLFDRFTAEIKKWAGANNKIMALNDDLEKLGFSNPVAMAYKLEGFIGDHHKAVAEAQEKIETRSQYSENSSSSTSRFGNWMNSTSRDNPTIRKALEDAAGPHTDFHAAIGSIQDALRRGDQEAARIVLENELLPAKRVILNDIEILMGEVRKAEEIYQEMVRINGEDVERYSTATLGYINELTEIRRKDISEVIVRNNASGHRTATIFLIFSALTLLGAISIGYFFGESLSKHLRSISERISQSSSETQAGADQVAQSSSSLADGANNQAASLEETSFSMEEMTTMITRDAELANNTAERALEADKNAKEGVKSMNELRTSVDSASESASELSSAMQAIKDSSDGISKIIKTIDEIAFQTNILALNAAVEAARAGEAGAGFAVVADEVRNLAQRAANAARETQNLIEDSVQRSERGVSVNLNLTEKLSNVAQLSGAVDDQLNAIANSISTVDQSMTELKSSVSDQQNGVNQINATIAQVNDITQTNASSAEETASASEQLNAQAGSMMAIVEELNGLVHGAKSQLSSKTSFVGAGAGLALSSAAMMSDPESRKGGKKLSGFALPDDFS